MDKLLIDRVANAIMEADYKWFPRSGKNNNMTFGDRYAKIAEAAIEAMQPNKDSETYNATEENILTISRLMAESDAIQDAPWKECQTKTLEEK